MRAKELWQAFMDTGAPELYLLYSEAKRMEITHVLEDKRPGTSGHSIQ